MDIEEEMKKHSSRAVMLASAIYGYVEFLHDLTGGTISTDTCVSRRVDGIDREIILNIAKHRKIYRYEDEEEMMDYAIPVAVYIAKLEDKLDFLLEKGLSAKDIEMSEQVYREKHEKHEQKPH